jgi:hypothetical protein
MKLVGLFIFEVIQLQHCLELRGCRSRMRMVGRLAPIPLAKWQKGQLVRFDLSQNGFDYVMGIRPLNTDENLRLWMFFTSGLSISDRANVTQFKFSFHDSTGEEFPCNSDYSIKTDMGIAIGTETTIGNVDLRMYSREPIPPDLREEGYP